MSGNVSQMCQDRYGAYTSDPQTNPLGPEVGSWRVTRDGSWNLRYHYTRSANRNANDSSHHEYVGFRVAKSP